MRDLGMDAWGIDWKGGRLTPECPALLMINITSPSEANALEHLLLHPKLAYVHFAPPCGTASRAREIRLPGGDPGPPPLRSLDYPEGLPDLAQRLPRELPRVRAANVLYSFVSKAVKKLLERKVLWSIKNPRESIFWWFPELKTTIERQDVDFVTFQHCAYGGERPKWTSFLHYPGGALADLHRVCPGEGPSHQHGKWGHTRAGALAT